MKTADYEDPIMELFELRNELEWVWDQATAYKGAVARAGDAPSMGQCGVTSAYLAKFFHREGYEVIFCEGDVYLGESLTPTIEYHCWLQLPDSPQNRARLGMNEALVVDLTADQTNQITESVIFEEESRLRARGIHYRTRTERSLSYFDEKTSLQRRLKTLEDKIFKYKPTIDLD